jgi:hypothetical protein
MFQPEHSARMFQLEHKCDMFQLEHSAMVVFITISYGRHETLILQLFAEVPTCRQMTMDSLGLSYDGRAAFLANLARFRASKSWFFSHLSVTTVKERS